jgi:hypothetical protein
MIDGITITDTVQTWVLCDLCSEPYRFAPGGGLSVPDECECCHNELNLEDAKTGYWFSHEDESEIHGPFDTEETARRKAEAAY